jgi:hypothetical protein
VKSAYTQQSDFVLYNPLVTMAAKEGGNISAHGYFQISPQGILSLFDF